MPIVTHTFSATVQADGRISYSFSMYDQDGTERGPYGGLLPANFDTEAWVTMKITEADVQLAEDEFRATVGL